MHFREEMETVGEQALGMTEQAGEFYRHPYDKCRELVRRLFPPPRPHPWGREPRQPPRSITKQVFKRPRQVLHFAGTRRGALKAQQMTLACSQDKEPSAPPRLQRAYPPLGVSLTPGCSSRGGSGPENLHSRLPPGAVRAPPQTPCRHRETGGA